MCDIKEIKKAAKMNVKENFGTDVLAEVIGYVVPKLVCAIPFAGWIFSGALEVGAEGIYIKGSEQEKPEIQDMLEGFRHNFGENFIHGLLRDLFTILWTMLFIVPGIVKSYSYAMSTYLLTRDQKMSGMGALRESMKRMKGHKRELFVLDLSFLGWILLTIITCGLAGIYTIPYIHAAHTEYFNRICMEA